MDFVPQDSHKDFIFKSKCNGKSSESLRKINTTDIFYICLAGTFSEIYFVILFLKTEMEELFFVSPGNISHILAPKFEILSIPYCTVRMFLRAK